MARFKTVLDVRSSRAVRDSIKSLKVINGRFTREETQLTRDVQKMMERKYLKPMMRELRKSPKRRTYPDDYPIQFKTDRQRRFVMALLAGRPYERTGRQKRGWRYRITSDAGKIKIKVYNRSPVSKYITGNIGYGESKRSMKRYIKPIQPFHEKTGWTPAYETVQEYVSNAREEAVEYVEEWYRKFIV